MGLMNSHTQEERTYQKDELVKAASEMRALDLTIIHAARSGHPGGTLSIMDVTAALFLNEARLDPGRPEWEDRDRIFFSAGHKAPAIYVALAQIGFYTAEEVVTLRKIWSPFQGHPHAPKLAGVEISSGSLGHGLSVAVGSALAASLDHKDYRVYCVMGDGEQQEGSIWEAVMTAGHYNLDNLCGIIDKNSLQIDGWVKDVMNIDPLAEKYRAFHWHVIEIDGHDMGQILDAFAEARTIKGKPTLVIANTIKGKGVSFMENEAGWHGIATKTEEQFAQAINDIACPTFPLEKARKLVDSAKAYQAEQQQKLQVLLPKFSKEYWWNAEEEMKVEMDPTRFGFGRCLSAIGGDERIVTIHADISNSIKITDFENEHPERAERVISVGIAEQNMMAVAAGLAHEGKIPITGTYGVFASGRPWDQIRTTICYDNLNVKIVGAHGGISVGADGATHQALEEISIMSILPNMNLFVPCDAIESEKLSKIAILDVQGPAYIRLAREATPVVTDDKTPVVAGKANVIRYRKHAANFKDAFETVVANEYQHEGETLALIACGPMVPEAMRAAYILKEEHDIETRVINIHTVKPIDEDALTRAVDEIGVIVTCEEHQKGGFGNIIAGVINAHKSRSTPLSFDMIGVEDRFGESGGPWELMITFHLTAEHIATKAKTLLERQ